MSFWHIDEDAAGEGRTEPRRRHRMGAQDGQLDGLDTSAWPEEQKNTFNQTLMNLQEPIQALLNPSETSDLA